MTLTTRRYGSSATAVQSGYGTIAAGNAKAVVYDAATVDVWISEIKLFCGKATGSTAKFRAAIYALDDNGVPSDRLGYTDEVTVSVAMSAAGVGGQWYTAAIAFVEDPTYSLLDGATTDAVPIQAGTRYAIDIEAIDASLGYSYDPGSTLVYARTAPGNPQPETFTGYVSSAHGRMTCYGQGPENVAPRPPANLSPDGDVFADSLVFSADFEDLNGAYGDSSGDGIATGDVLNQYHIQARTSSDSYLASTGLIWNTKYEAKSPEYTTNQMYRVYGGETLVPDTDIEWRVRFSDALGEWSEWSDWTQVHVSTAGIVTLEDDPQSTIQEITPDFYGRWSHTSLEAMTKVKVRLLEARTNRPIYTSPEITKAAASSALPGTLFEVTWASTGFSDLAWGRTYKYQMSGKDTSGVWSDWSNRRQFKTNQPPRVPSTLNPRSSQVYGAYPLLTCRASDNDDTVATGLEVHAEIVRPDLSLVDVAMTYNATTAQWEFQTTGTQVTAEGVYYWAAYSWDGTLYSGEVTDLAYATRSSLATFSYYAGPTCVLSAPADGDVITASTIAVAWTSTGYIQWRVLVYDDDGETAYDSGTTTEASTQTAGSHTVPSGYVANGQSYRVLVTVVSGVGLVGTSDLVTVAIDYTQPDAPPNIQAVAVAIGTDINASAIRVSWDLTIYGDDEDMAFEAYVITRSAASGPDTVPIVLARLTNAAAVAVIDYLPAAGIDYTYGISVIVRTGVDELQSEVISTTASITLAETVLVAIDDPQYRAVLANVRERAADAQNERATYTPLSGDKPTTVRALSRFKTLPISAAIVDDAVLTARERRDELDLLDAHLGTVCIRYADGTKYFIDIQDLKIVDQHGGYYTASFTGIEQQVTEGTT